MWEGSWPIVGGEGPETRVSGASETGFPLPCLTVTCVGEVTVRSSRPRRLYPWSVLETCVDPFPDEGLSFLVLIPPEGSRLT